MRAARAMTMAAATKRAMATYGNNTGTGDGKDGDEQAMAATTEQRTWLLTLC